MAIVLSHSKTPFVLLGPDGKYRSILVRNYGDNLDLAGLDQYWLSYENSRSSSSDPILRFFGLGPPERHIVGSFGAPIRDDSRQTYFGFAWRGFATERDIRRIESLFEESQSDLSTALEEKDEARLEWLIARIVLRCEQADERIKYRRRTLFVSMRSVALLYAVILAAYVYKFFLFRSG